MNLNQITQEALTEALSLARQMGFNGQESKNTPLAQSLQIGQVLFKSNNSRKQDAPKKGPSLCAPVDGWCWGP